MARDRAHGGALAHAAERRRRRGQEERSERFGPDIRSARHPWSSVPEETDDVGIIGNMPTAVRIATVSVTKHRPNQRTTYLVTLSCGCQFWEDRDTAARPRAIGTAAVCYASHDKPQPPSNQ
jgi:hypothetical protein